MKLLLRVAPSGGILAEEAHNVEVLLQVLNDHSSAPFAKAVALGHHDLVGMHFAARWGWGGRSGTVLIAAVCDHFAYNCDSCYSRLSGKMVDVKCMVHGGGAEGVDPKGWNQRGGHKGVDT